MKRAIALTTLLVLSLASLGLAAQVEAPVDVAPKAEGTRCQSDPAAAWCEGGKCWLVAWNEGYANEETADIWCARIGADGKALDQSGIRLTKQDKGQRSMASVASDGKGFLVVWQDLRGGKAWNVYGARVTAEGKALDPEGFLIAGGDNNRAMPAATFAAGNYLVGWQALDNGAYDLFGARVSPEGKVLDAAPMNLAGDVSKRGHGPRDRCGQAHSMGLAAFGDKAAVVGCVTQSAADPSTPAGGAFDVGGAKALTPMAASIFLWHNGDQADPSKRNLLSTTRAQNRRAYAAWSADGKGFAETFVPYNRYGGNAIGLLFFDESGKEKDAQRIQFAKCAADSVDATLIFLSVASDGEQYLVVYQHGVAFNRGRREQLRGCYVSYDGKKLSDGDGFAIADDPARSIAAGPVVSGPKGVCLVVHPDTRDFDNTKIVAQLVKSK